MGNSKVHIFLSQRGNRLLLLCVSFALSVACVAPHAGSYMETRNQRIASEHMLLEVDDFETTVADLQEQLKDVRRAADRMNRMMVSDDDTEQLRNQVTEMVRIADCRLRNLTLAERTSRRWMENDNPLKDGHQFDEADEEPFPTDYMLETQRLELSVSGDFANTQELARSIFKMRRLVSTSFLEIQADPNQGDTVIRWELVLYNLVYSPEEEFDDWE